MIDPVPPATAKKNEAKNLRRKNPPDFEQAVACLKQAISILEDVPLSPPPAPLGKMERSVAAELADCWGSLGGTYRAWGKPGKAYKCYDTGLRYESDPRLPANSYNLVNRLLVRFAMPSADDSEISRDAGDPVDQLKSTRAEVARQAKGPRRGDMWVHADHMMVNLLARDREAAVKARDEFDRLAIVEYAYTTTRNVLLDLSNMQTLTVDVHEGIQESLGWFEDAIQRKAWIKLPSSR